MLKVNKTPEPDFFIQFKSHNKLSNWNEYNNHIDIKQKLKNHMLDKEQRGYCPYCEIKISYEDILNEETCEIETKYNDCEIEHIEPKDKFPNKFQTYDNLITCCKTPKRCGNSKGNNWDIAFINPVLDDPKDYLTYDIKTGKIIPIEKDNEKATYTINTLNLNEKKLVGARKNFIRAASTNKGAIDYFEEFPSLKEYLKENF